MCFSSSFTVHVDANSRLARLKQLLHDIPPHNLAVVKRIMFHLNRYEAFCNMFKERLFKTFKRKMMSAYEVTELHIYSTQI